MKYNPLKHFVKQNLITRYWMLCMYVCMLFQMMNSSLRYYYSIIPLILLLIIINSINTIYSIINSII